MYKEITNKLLCLKSHLQAGLPRIKEFVNTHSIFVLFCGFLFFYLFSGQNLTYNYEFLTEVFDVYFWADIPRVLEDLAKFEGAHCHYHSMVHNFIVFFINPIVSLMKGVFHDGLQCVVILESLVGSACVCLIYSILNCITQKKELSLTFSMLFGVSFSTILFSAIPESYIFSAFFQLLFWRYIIQLIYVEKPENLSFLNIITLSLFGVIIQGIVFSSLLLFFLGIFYLLKSIYPQNLKKLAMNGANLLISFGVILGVLYLIQTRTWGHISNLFDTLRMFHLTGECGDFRYMNFNFDWEKFANTLTQTLASPIALSQVYMWPNENENQWCLPVFAVDDQFSIWNIFTLLMFYIIPLVYLIKNFKNLAHKNLIITLISIVAVSFIYNLFYGYTIGPSESILFSQNYLYAVFIALGLVISQVKYEKVLFIFRLLFQYVLILNFYQIFKIKQYIYNLTLLSNNNYTKFLTFAGMITLAVIGICLLLKKGLRKEIFDKILSKKFEFLLWSYCAFVIAFAFLSHIDKF